MMIELSVDSVRATPFAPHRLLVLKEQAGRHHSRRGAYVSAAAHLDRRIKCCQVLQLRESKTAQLST
jgi:hypothetical protein